METKNSYNEERFDSYINKTIILCSKSYFKMQMNYINNEKYIIDDEDFCGYLESNAISNNRIFSIEDAELLMLLNDATNSLSKIEQKAINLLFKDELEHQEIGKKLNVHPKSITRIRKRSLEKIISLFYIEHCSTNEIAEELNVSSAYISKIIKSDERYIQEKQYRKSLAKKENWVKTNL